MNQITGAIDAMYRVKFQNGSTLSALAHEIKILFNNGQIPIDSYVSPVIERTFFWGSISRRSYKWITIVDFLGMDIISEAVSAVTAFTSHAVLKVLGELSPHSSERVRGLSLPSDDEYVLWLTYMYGALIRYSAEYTISPPDSDSIAIQVQKRIFLVTTEKAKARESDVFTLIDEKKDYDRLLKLGAHDFDNSRTDNTKFDASGLIELVRILRATPSTTMSEISYNQVSAVEIALPKMEGIWKSVVHYAETH